MQNFDMLEPNSMSEIGKVTPEGKRVLTLPSPLSLHVAVVCAKE